MQTNFDTFETDENLTIMLFYKRQPSRQVNLYAVRWEFDTYDIDFELIKKLDEQKLEIQSEVAASIGQSILKDIRRPSVIAREEFNLHGRKKKCCTIF